MKTKKILLLISIVILFNCQSDREKYYYLDQYDLLDGYPYGTTIYKSSSKSHIPSQAIVYSDILEFKENNSYIITLQKPNKELMLKRIKSSLEVLYKYNSGNDSVVVSFPHTFTNVGINKRYKKDLDSLVKMTQDSSKAYRAEAENIFQDEAFYQRIYKNPLNYYIIDKKEDSVFGPLTKKEYRNIKEKRGIKLEFKN